MDSFRGSGGDWSGESWAYAGQEADGGAAVLLRGAPAQDSPDDEEPDDMPPAIGQDERRMQVRAYNMWADMLGDGNFPDIVELDPTQCGEFGAHSVLLDFSGGIEDPLVRHLGKRLAAECGAPGDRFVGQLSDVPAGSLISRITDHYIQILSRQAPIGFEAEFVNRFGKLIAYRGILLPFSSDDRTIDHIYGVLNWKEVADTPLSQALQGAVAGAVAARKHTPANLADPLPPPLSRRLRAITPRGLDDLPDDGPEFTLLLARRMSSGNVMLLSEVPFDAALMQRAADRLED